MLRIYNIPLYFIIFISYYYMFSGLMEVTEWLTLLTASLSSLYNMFCYFAVVKAI